MPTDGSASSVIILLPADGILDMVVTENILLLLLERNEGFK